MKFSTRYVIGFAVAICVVCAIFVAGAAVALREKQNENRLLDRYEKVLAVAGLKEEGQKLPAEEIKQRYNQYIEPRVVDLSTGEYVKDVDAAAFDMQAAMKDPSSSRAAPANAAKVTRLPNQGIVYLVKEGDEVSKLVLPIEGKGLWSTLYGFIALDADAQTVRGITYYEHGETPGLGGEVDNPKWKKQWDGRKVFDPQGKVKLTVLKGQAGPAAQDPYSVDGLSGATITARGVTYMIQLWLGPEAFGPYLEKFRNEQRRAL